MSNCFKKNIFHIKLLKTGFVANDKWRQVPGFEVLRHIFLKSVLYLYLYLYKLLPTNCEPNFYKLCPKKPTNVSVSYVTRRLLNDL